MLPKVKIRYTPDMPILNFDIEFLRKKEIQYVREE